ncbi:MAG TPA: hypothetical protein ENG83_12075 [Nitrospirae bacterium]|nr:hypothetical protein BMS3Abin06_02855 [bacterium BMS3Abin06]HDH12912.1 hypothetical protein [Nitrospirota bacterium]HDZ01676.1 hypothetical protein [Nitrospirota bacterium]
MNTYYYINLLLLLIFPFFLYYVVCSRIILHPIIISMCAGVYTYFIGVHLIVANRPDSAEKFFYLIVAMFLGCYFGRGRKTIKPEYNIEFNRKNALTHLAPYKSAVVFSLFLVFALFLYKGIPIFAVEPNFAKVTIAHGGGWIITRFVRYFLFILFYVSIIYCFYQIKERANSGDRNTGIMRRGNRGWIIMGVIMLILFAFLGFKSNVIGFFLWTICFIALLTRIRLKHVMVFFLIGGVISLIILMKLEGANLQETISFIIARVGVGSSAGFAWILGSYGRSYEFLHGEGFWFDFSNILLRLGLQPFIPFELHKYNFDAFMFDRLMGHNEYLMQVNTSVFGQLYANFGLTTMVLGAYLFFYLYSKMGNFLVTHKKTLIGTPVYFFLFIQLQTFVGGGPVLITIFDTILSLLMFFTLYFVIYLFVYLPYGRLSFKIP